MSIKKNFFAPLASGLGATRRAAVLLLVMMLTTATAWADGISYLDATGTQQSCTTYTTVESSSTFWNSGWFVVNSNTTISDRITVSGTVNLILTNNATLTASKGITVGSDATLNIYAQTDDEATMGALVASGANDNQQYNAGIGGVDNTAAGTITINGGKINATGKVGAGIGSGGQSGATVGTITINGGIVTAQDGDGYGAGIGGGGILGKASTINLNGGIINAAGIGSGYLGGDCSITVNISDGIRKIVATPVQGGACIGKGKSASGSVTVNFISGGNIVTGDDKDAVFYDTDEGSERQIRTKALNHTVSMSDDLKAHITVSTELAITGETVTLTLGTAVEASTLKVNDGTSDLTLTDAGNRNYTFTMPAGNVTVTASTATTYSVNLPANMEIVSATITADGDGKYISGTVVTFKASFSYTASNVHDGANTLTADGSGNYSVTVGTADITVTATIEHSSNIDLSQAPGDFTVVDGDILTAATSHTVTIAENAKITLSNATISGGIVCDGTAEITLVGTNSVTGASFKAGIQVGGFGTTLTIKGNGSLTANGGNQSAGIGLSRAWDVDATGGDIVIEGGNITANGSVNNKWGAGIGTGVIYGGSKTARLGNITIKGGTVTANGGTSADGIGTGFSYSGCTNEIGTVTIYDGIDKVDASSIKNSGSIVYKHDENDVTASTSDYFTIIENGNRRIIVQKVTPTIADVPDQTYTGSEIKPEPLVMAGSLSLTKGTDYVYSYTNNTNVGTAKVIATFQGDYASLGYVEKEFIIAPKAVTNENITITIPEQTYTGSVLTPVITVKDGETVLTENTDYTVTAPSGTIQDAGNYSYTITGQGNYKGETTATFTIAQKAVTSDDITITIPSQTWTGNELTPVITVKDGETVLTLDEDYTVTAPSGPVEDSGNYTYTITGMGNYSGETAATFTIAKSMTNDDIIIAAITVQTYTGSAIEPAVTVTDGETTLTLGTDYTIGYSANVNVGTATATITGKGNYSGEKAATFTIIPKAVTNKDISITIPSQTRKDNELTPVITVKDGETVLTLDEDYTVTAPSGPIQDSGNYTYTITGMGNYAGSREAMFTIADQLITADGQTISDATTWKNGVVSITGNSTVTFSERITISGTVTLNLGEGTTLTAPKGIEVDKGNTLTIEGNGALNATADKFYAAIGRGFHDSTSGTSGTININGGTVTAIGGRFAAAIGGGYEGVSGTINISGGTIVATGGYCAAGIGGGTFAACGVVNISGGQVTANGDRASGIGPGFDAGTSGTVTLGWTNESDGILASNYNDVETLRVADGKAFTASTGNIYIGTLDDDQRAEFAGKTLKPVVCTGISLTKESQGLTATIDGTSTATINIPTAVTVDNVTYNRTFTVGKASTVMLPFNYTCTGNEGGTFYQFVGIEKDGNDWVATMKATGDDANNAGTLTANTPYLFLPTETGITFTIPNTGVSLCTAGGGDCMTADAGSHWTFKGTYSYVKWTTDSSDDGYSAEHAAEIGKAYGFAGVEKTGIEVGDFVKVAEGAKVRPMSCYLLWSNTSNNARALTRGATTDELPKRIVVKLVDNGTVTNIGEIDTKTGDVTFDGWYTIDGVRLSGKPSKSGLYINNGRKVIIK